MGPQRHRLLCAMLAGDFDTPDTPGDARARAATMAMSLGILDVSDGRIPFGAIAACGRRYSKHGAPLFGWRHQRRANARRLMQRARRFKPTTTTTEEAPF